jgi:signal transduction histidine kinase
MADPEYNWGAAQQLGGYRTVLGVPLLRDGSPVGVIIVARTIVQPFSEKQIELVTTFADQAVIAIENARLFDEVQARTRDLSESLEQQTATSEILQVISGSPGELVPVFEAILGNATRICDAKFGTLTQVVDGIPRLMFQLRVPASLDEYWRREMPRPSPHNAISRVISTGQAVHVTDLQAHQAYIDRDALAVAGVELGGIRTLLIVPMLKDDKTFGTIGIYRQEVRAFTDKQVELVSSFAAQAAIAIENTRLLKELQRRTDDLSKSLDNLRTAQDRLVQTQKLASLGQLTAGIAHEIKNPLNFVNNFSGVSVELIDELQDALKGLPIDQKARAEITELSDTLRGNLDKVVQHGKRADAIVKNMLLHSREGSGEHRPVDINAIVEESLNLAYHGARAEKQGFNITLERSLDPTAGEVDVFPQDITRVLLNLIANGFYAATKRKTQAGSDGYEPTLSASTRSLGDQVEIRIRDNGTGIPPEVKEKMFNPFFTTKPAGEGTGLGLSISHDIIVKQHGGAIDVDTKLGAYTEFRIVLPRTSATVGKTGGLE